MTTSTTHLPYHEPSITTLLTTASFLLTLNIVDRVFDELIYCGLVGQVLVGVLFGIPGAGWLDGATQEVVVRVGYLGLVMIVYEGGLSLPLPLFIPNALLSTLIALVGIVLPISLSFALIALLPGTTKLQAFAAGAALCSTSLGTTFTVLKSSGLERTRLGVVLSSAAMLDDIVGLVLVGVVSKFGTENGNGAVEFRAATVLRPIFVSLGFGIAVPGFCWTVLRPLRKCILRSVQDGDEPGKGMETGLMNRARKWKYTTFLVHTAVLIGLVTAATYAGTSGLFAAYLAGAGVSWWDSYEIVPSTNLNSLIGADAVIRTGDEASECQAGSSTASAGAQTTLNHAQEEGMANGLAVYEQYYAPVVQRVLKPFFFASIGFAIPVRLMFRPDVVWRGLVYTILMLFAKLATGLGLVRFKTSGTRGYWESRNKWSQQRPTNPEVTNTERERVEEVAKEKKHGQQNKTSKHHRIAIPEAQSPASPSPMNIIHTSEERPPRNPLSLYPAAILGTAMTARGEIGFLIASLAEASGVFHRPAPSSSPFGGEGTLSETSSEIYLIITWAIVLCTIIGPVMVGLLAARVKKLRSRSRKQPGDGRNVSGNGIGSKDPLGIWVEGL